MKQAFSTQSSLSRSSGLESGKAASQAAVIAGAAAVAIALAGVATLVLLP